MLEFLRQVPLFRDLEEPQLARVLATVRLENLPPGHILFRQGDPVDAFYLVRDGAVTVFRDAVGRPQQVLARIWSGGFFGEMGLLQGGSRLASARVAAPTSLLRIAREDLLALLADHPVLEARLRSEAIRRHGLNVSAVLEAGDRPDVRIRVGVEAQATLGDGTAVPLRLENLSERGLGLSGAPSAWRPGRSVRFTLGRSGEPDLLEVEGVVRWRQDDLVGISFTRQGPALAATVRGALRRFLARPSAADELQSSLP